MLVIWTQEKSRAKSENKKGSKSNGYPIQYHPNFANLFLDISEDEEDDEEIRKMRREMKKEKLPISHTTLPKNPTRTKGSLLFLVGTRRKPMRPTEWRLVSCLTGPAVYL